MEYVNKSYKARILDCRLSKGKDYLKEKLGAICDYKEVLNFLLI